MGQPQRLFKRPTLLHGAPCDVQRLLPSKRPQLPHTVLVPALWGDVLEGADAPCQSEERQLTDVDGPLRIPVCRPQASRTVWANCLPALEAAAGRTAPACLGRQVLGYQASNGAWVAGCGAQVLGVRSRADATHRPPRVVPPRHHREGPRPSRRVHCSPLAALLPPLLPSLHAAGTKALPGPLAVEAQTSALCSPASVRGETKCRHLVDEAVRPPRNGKVGRWLEPAGVAVHRSVQELTHHVPHVPLLVQLEPPPLLQESALEVVLEEDRVLQQLDTLTRHLQYNVRVERPDRSCLSKPIQVHGVPLEQPAALALQPLQSRLERTPLNLVMKMRRWYSCGSSWWGCRWRDSSSVRLGEGSSSTSTCHS